MAEVVINTIIKFKRGNSADWTRKNILLESGEPGYEIDTGKLKVGNGVTRWNDLKYIGGGAIDVDVDGLSIVVDNVGRISLAGFAEARAGYAVRKNASGALEWYEPATAAEMDTVNRTLTMIQNTIGDDKSGIVYTLNDLNAKVTTLTVSMGNVYTKAEADAKISAEITSKLADAGLTLVTVASVNDIDLTAEDANKHIYLVPKDAETNDVYDEYVVTNGKLEHIGSTSVNMDGYITEIDFEPIKAKVNSLPTSILTGASSVNANDDGLKITLKKASVDVDGKYVGDQFEDVTIPVATTTTAGVMSKDDKAKLDKIDPDESATITGAKIGEEDATVENKKILIPLASENKAGAIKSSSDMNHIKVAADGTSEVSSLGVDKLENVDGVTLVLCAGGAESIN